MINDAILIKKEVTIVISPQAQKILAMSNHSVEDFIDWICANSSTRFGVGGGDVMVYLEQKYNKDKTAGT